MFGRKINNLTLDGQLVNYPVLNERDARAGAGLMLALAVLAFVMALFRGQRIILFVTVILFTIEFIIRVIDPYYAPFYSLGRLIVKKQKPEWTGAIQKRFAWSLGLIMAVSMIFIAIIFGIRGAIPFTICSICLFLLWIYFLINLQLIKIYF